MGDWKKNPKNSTSGKDRKSADPPRALRPISIVKEFALAKIKQNKQTNKQTPTAVNKSTELTEKERRKIEGEMNRRLEDD